MRKITIISCKIISGYPHNTCSISMDVGAMFNWKMSEMFRPASAFEVKKKITKSPEKSRDLDPLPTWLLNKFVDQLLLLITAIINRSIGHSSVGDTVEVGTSQHNSVAYDIWVRYEVFFCSPNLLKS